MGVFISGQVPEAWLTISSASPKLKTSRSSPMPSEERYLELRVSQQPCCDTILDLCFRTRARCAKSCWHFAWLSGRAACSPRRVCCLIHGRCKRRCILCEVRCTGCQSCSRSDLLRGLFEV